MPLVSTSDSETVGPSEVLAVSTSMSTQRRGLRREGDSCLPIIFIERAETSRNFSVLLVTGDESVREDERSDDEEKDENVKGYICQLLDQRTASQRRDKSCAPSH